MLSTEVLSMAGTRGGNSPKHHWTEEELEVVRRDYRGTNASAQEIADKLGPGVTKWGVKGKAAALGILQPKSPDWTSEELLRLSKLVHTHSVSQVAKMLGRSANAVKIKATRLKLSLRVHFDWFTKKEVCEILGVDHHKVQEWIDNGLIQAAWHDEKKPQAAGMAMWHITYESLKNFLIKHSELLVGRNVNIQYIIWLLSKDNQATDNQNVCSLSGAAHHWKFDFYEQYISQGKCLCGAVKYEASTFIEESDKRKILGSRIKYLNDTKGRKLDAKQNRC